MQQPSLAREDILALADFRFRIRRFLAFSEQAARAAGLEPQQHQMLLAIAGLPDDLLPTIGVLADRLQIQHHSAVELINRLAQRELIVRERDDIDRRRVIVRVSAYGERILRDLSTTHWEELRSAGPDLTRALSAIVHADNSFRDTDLPDQSATGGATDID